MTGTKVDRVLGVVVFVVVVGAWLAGKRWGIDTSELVAFSVPVIGALFLVGPINKAADSSAQAAAQTNGVLGARIEAAVSAALAKRDAARTRQAQGDISGGPGTPTAPGPQSVEDTPTASPTLS